MLNYNLSICNVVLNLFFSALVVIDNMKDSKAVEDVSSDDSTIDIMSSGDEQIDITNDLDPPESSNKYITDVNGSSSELAQEYLFS